MKLHFRTDFPARAALLALFALTAMAAQAGDLDDIKPKKGEKVERYRIVDADFKTKFPGEGTLSPNLQLNFMPTQKPGVTEIRIIISLPGGEFTPFANLIPVDMPDFNDQEFCNDTKDRKDKLTVPDFKGITLGGNSYQEARRSVMPGKYKLVAVASRGAEFGRVTEAEVSIPAFSEGQLAITSFIFTDKPEKAAVGEPLTIGEYRLIPHSGNYKAGDKVIPFLVVYGAKKSGGSYKLKADFTCHVEFNVPKKSTAKVDFNKTNIQEKACGTMHSNSPLIGVEEGIKVPPPPQPSVKVGKETVPLLTNVFKFKVVITDENNSNATVDTGWKTIPVDQ